MTEHKQIPMTMKTGKLEQKCNIDIHIAPILEKLWKFDISTHLSCEGNYPNGYFFISFCRFQDFETFLKKILKATNDIAFLKEPSEINLKNITKTKEIFWNLEIGKNTIIIRRLLWNIKPKEINQNIGVTTFIFQIFIPYALYDSIMNQFKESSQDFGAKK